MAKKRGPGRRRVRGEEVMSDADAMTKLVTGRRNKHNTWKHQLRDLIKTHGSEEARQRVGVSKSTWWAWNTGRRNPNRGNQTNIVGQWNTREVRAAIIPTSRRRRASADGFVFTLKGNVGFIDPEYRSIRTLAGKQLSPEAADDVMDAWITGGPDAAKAQFQRALAREYFEVDPDKVPAFADDITAVNFKPGPIGAGGGSYFDDFNE